ncbi:MAG: hypothetical protein JWO89_2111 [Verrucomicrobiaceae bacterium]|nr:hypothetical protein [Verrucomicrobiaceae bacterium]
MSPPDPSAEKPAPPSDPNVVWASYGDISDGEAEDFIVGSREGLQRLKEHIEIAIEQGESLTGEDEGIEFPGIRRLDRAKDSAPESSSTLPAWGCGCGIAIALSILVLAFLGLKSLLPR